MQAYTADGSTTHAGNRIDGWAGVFDCSVCRRKRLIGSEFSKKMLERGRGGGLLTCKACIAEKAEAERAAAAAKRAAKAKEEESIFDATGAGGGAGASAEDAAAAEPELHECAKCKEQLPAAAFNRTQLRNKGPGKQRCMECVSAAVAEEDRSQQAAQGSKLADLKAKAKKADATGNAVQRLLTNSALAAAEAELVTGLKPMIIGRPNGRGGRGRGRGGGTWRGRGRK
jgi:hypothetical protein